MSVRSKTRYGANMRWEIVCLVLGWTIGLVRLPLLLVTLFSIYVEGIEPALRTFAIPLLLALFSGYALVALSGAGDASSLSLIHI